MKSVALKAVVAVAFPMPQHAAYAYCGQYLWSAWAWILQGVSILVAGLAFTVDAKLQGPPQSSEDDEIKSILRDVFLLFGAAAGSILAFSRY
ncbi:MAG: hypothetical protein QY327_04055 [Fimbriimonadaceae bacterium]|nr:MAG: hypothetical protein QY327_04055 [Fimbriimonadaceae bacterium]